MAKFQPSVKHFSFFGVNKRKHEKQQQKKIGEESMLVGWVGGGDCRDERCSTSGGR